MSHSAVSILYLLNLITFECVETLQKDRSKLN